MPRPAGSTNSASTAAASATPRWLPAGPTTPSASNTSPTTSATSSNEATMLSAPSSAPAGTAATSAGTDRPGTTGHVPNSYRGLLLSTTTGQPSPSSATRPGGARTARFASPTS